MMNYILNIDTATETAHISIAANGTLLYKLVNEIQKDHAAFVQPAIEQALKDTGLNFADIKAVAVTAGPGSYTGIRVGMASAKGICYALNKPFIAVNTLAVMAKAATLQMSDENILYCPMIDARRMEVFTAVYNIALQEVMPPCALILDENSFAGYLQHNTLLFTGNGAAKWKPVINNANALFLQLEQLPVAFAALSYQYYSNKSFANLAYTDPFYIKEFKANG